MSLYKRTDSPRWWVKISHGGRTIQRSTGTEDKAQAQEYHDKLKVSLWEQQRLGVKPRRAWKEAVVRWLAETSEKATHDGDIKKLRWLDPFLGTLMLDEITLDVIDRVKSERLKTVSKSTVNRYLAVVRSILFGHGTNGSGSTRRRRSSCSRNLPGGNGRSPLSRRRHCCANCQRISATSCSSRWPPGCGSQMCSGSSGRT